MPIWMSGSHLGIFVLLSALCVLKNCTFTNFILIGTSSHALLASSGFLPLIEEKRDLSSQALIPNMRDPLLHDWTRIWTRLTTHNYPIDLS